MDTLVLTPQVKLEKGSCLSGQELQENGIVPTNLQCFSYYHYALYEKGNKRIILKPLPHNLYKVIRTYEFISA